jgi:calcineurin-like phosphoesterase family protein
MTKKRKHTQQRIKTYLISDTHFNHARIISDFGFRPADFADQFIKNCQKIIRPKDRLIHLGDVIWGNKKQLTTILKQIPGIKTLVRGNHDRVHSNTFFYEAGFATVCDRIELKEYVFSHWPVLINNDKINIHGHFHNIPRRNWEESLVERLTENHYLLSAELTNYCPVELETAISQKKVIKTIEVEF